MGLGPAGSTGEGGADSEADGPDGGDDGADDGPDSPGDTAPGAGAPDPEPQAS